MGLAVRQHVVVYGITMTVEGDDIGYGSRIGLGVVEGNEAARQGTNQPFLGLPTKTNELFHSINILLYSVLALCGPCVIRQPCFVLDAVTPFLGGPLFYLLLCNGCCLCLLMVFF